jgi:RNA polymerase sigma-70 factor (ECF subfamily)
MHPTATEARPHTREEFEREALAHLDSVYCFARSLTGQDSAAEDLTQDTYLNALRAWRQYTPGTNCRAWLFTICRNLRAKQAVQERREEPAELAELESLASAALYAATGGGVERALFDRMDVSDAVRRAIAKLPEEYREVVALADVHDQSYDTIAHVLGVPVGTVKSRLYRGRRLLQEELTAYAQDAGITAGKGEGG